MSHLKPLRDTQPPDWNIIPPEPIEGPEGTENTVKTRSNGLTMSDCLPELKRRLMDYQSFEDMLRVKLALGLNLIGFWVMFYLVRSYSNGRQGIRVYEIATGYPINGNARSVVIKHLREHLSNGLIRVRMSADGSKWYVTEKGLKLFIAAMNEK